MQETGELATDDTGSGNMAKAFRQRATAARVRVGLPEVRLFRETGQHSINRNGEAMVDSEINLQLVAESASMSMEVRASGLHPSFWGYQVM